RLPRFDRQSQGLSGQYRRCKHVRFPETLPKRSGRCYQWLMAEGQPNGNGAGRMTIREIADLAGVSIATVSRVVNGRGDVSAATREIVQRVVREHGYSVNRSA